MAKETIFENLKSAIIDGERDKTLTAVDAALKQGVPPADIIRGVVPFIVLVMVGLALCIAFPEIILWLPKTMIG